MGLLNYLTFDGVKTSSFSVFISGEGTFNAPARRGEIVTVPGRNGTLFMDNDTFENIQVTYPAFIGSGHIDTFREKLAGIRSELTSRQNYKRLTDSYHPDEFRLAVYRSGIETDPSVYNRAGQFNIVFDCKPQRFLVSGEDPVVFTSGGNIHNPTLFNAKPLIKVVGNGKVKIEPYEFIVTDNPGEIYIDSELYEAYKLVHILYNLTDEELEIIQDERGVNIEVAKEATTETMAQHVEFIDYQYPQIKPGDVPVLFSSGISEVTIIPRWWRL